MDGFLILSIETATSCGSVSLTRGCGPDFHLLAEYSTQPDVTHSRRLFNTIDHVMQGAETNWQDLDAVAVSLGPGSFTGLRIGMAAAKAIAMAAGQPLIGVDTLDALALNVCGAEKMVGCLLDARKKEVYGCFYRDDENGIPRPVTDPVAVSPDRLAADLEHPVYLIGSGARLYRDIFTGNELVQIGPEFLATPRASLVGQLAGERFVAGQLSDPETVVPKYVRASEAEVNLKKRRRER